MSITKRRIVRRKESTSSPQLELLSPGGRDENCRKCPLWESAENICMWGRGPRRKIMLILDAPNLQEDRTGDILKGQSGDLIKSLFKEFKIDLKNCYVTYAVKCHGPEGRAPTGGELKACKPYLEQEIRDVDPEWIVTMGANALKQVLRKSKITELHGQVLDFGDAKLIPTFHPAIALRDPSKLPGLRDDIRKLSNALNGNVPSDDDIHWEVVRTLDRWNEVVEEILESPEVALDIETTGLDRNEKGAAINTIQVSLASGRNYSIPLEVRDSPWRLKSSIRQNVMDTLIEACEGKIVIGHNFKFDNLWVKKIYGAKFHLTFDTMLAHHVLDENTPHGLKELSVRFCNAPAYDVDLKTKLGLGDLNKFYKYGCRDTYYTLQLYYQFRSQLLKDMSLRRLFYRLVMPVARMFEDVEEEGLFINMERLAEVKEELTEQRENLLDELGRDINWNSPSQIADYLYETLKLPIIEKTGKGAPSTSESVLQRLDHPIPKKLIEYRGIEKNLSTYVVGWEKLMHGDRLYMSTKIHGTVTGRFASRLHQVPRNPLIRSLIDAPEGWLFVCADYSQIELRLAAMLSGDVRMKSIFATGGDIHMATAMEVLGHPESQISKEERKMAKAVNFGLVYGMGAPKLQIYARDNYGVDMSSQQSGQFRKRYFERYNGLLPWHERQRRCVRTFGQVTSLSGRVRRLPGIYSNDRGVRAEAERQGINSPVQGFGSGDLKAMGMVEIHNTIPHDTCQVKGEVHDSVLLWVREEVADEILTKVKTIMESPSLLKVFKIHMTVPLVVDIEVGPWGKGKKWHII